MIDLWYQWQWIRMDINGFIFPKLGNPWCTVFSPKLNDQDHGFPSSAAGGARPPQAQRSQNTIRFIPIL